MLLGMLTRFWIIWKKLSPLESLSLLELSEKLLMLLLLLSCQSRADYSFGWCENIFIDAGNVKIIFGDLLKTSKQGKHLAELNFSAFPSDKDLCILETLKYFLQRIFKIRTEGNPVMTKLFLTTQRPYKAVSRDIICRWTKNILRKSGIDVNIFKPHSTKAVSTTAAFSSKVPLATILRTAGWQKHCTFRKVYKKPIVVDK